MKLLNFLPLVSSLLLGCISLASATPTIVIYAVGSAPLADAGPDRPDTLVSEGPIVLPTGGSVNVTMNGFGTTDADNNIVSLSWKLGSTTLSGYGPTFTFTTTGTFTIELTVTDADGNVSVDSMTVIISPPSTGPVTLTPASNQLVECNGSGNLTQLNAWLASNGGASAPADAGPVVWTNNYNALTSWVDGTAPVCEQAIVTFTATFANGNAGTTTAAFQIKDTVAPPLNWTVNGNPVADFTILTVPGGATTTVKVIPNDLCGGSTLQKSYNFLSGSGTVAYSSSVGGTANDTVTLTSASPNAKVRFYFKATDECGNSSATEWVEIDVVKQTLALKGNEGVGNGIDPDTPGALHNGNNDAPGFFPGNPGAKNKRP